MARRKCLRCGAIMLRGVLECPACGALPLRQQMLGGFGLLVALVVLAFIMVWVARLLLGPYPSPPDGPQSGPAGKSTEALAKVRSKSVDFVEDSATQSWRKRP